MKKQILLASLALIALSAVGTASPTTVTKEPSETVLKADYSPSVLTFEISRATAPVEGVLVEIENPDFSYLSGFYVYENTGKIPCLVTGMSAEKAVIFGLHQTFKDMAQRKIENYPLDIDVSTPEGRYLMAAVIHIKDKHEPERSTTEILQDLDKTVQIMYPDNPDTPGATG